MMNTHEERIFRDGTVTSQDLELLYRLKNSLLSASGAGEKPQLLRDINKIILEYDEQKLRLVYFFAKEL